MFSNCFLVGAILSTLILGATPPRETTSFKRQIIGPNGCCLENLGDPCIKYPSVNGTVGVNGTCDEEPDGINIPYCKGVYNLDGCSLETLGQLCVISGYNSTCIIAPDPWDTVYACAVPGEP